MSYLFILENSVEVSFPEPEEAPLGQLQWAVGQRRSGALVLRLVTYNLEVIFSSIQIWVFSLCFNSPCTYFALWRLPLSVALCRAPPKAEAQLSWP